MMFSSFDIIVKSYTEIHYNRCDSKSIKQILIMSENLVKH
jgi:hypothetical protein